MSIQFNQQTVNTLAYQALHTLNIVGRGESATGQQIADAIYCLNELLDSWNSKGIMIYSMQINQYALSTPPPHGSSTTPMGPFYTIGPGGDFDTGANPRPVNITFGSFLVPGSSTPNDLPMIQLTADEYSGIRAKKTTSNIATYFYYQPDFPLGKVYFWPEPVVGTSVKFTSYNSLPTTLTANDAVLFPAGYAKAIRYQLIMSLAPMYGKPIPVDISAVYEDMKSDLAITNIVQRIGKFKYPSNMPGSSGTYNIYTDDSMTP